MKRCPYRRIATAHLTATAASEISRRCAAFRFWAPATLAVHAVAIVSVACAAAGADSYSEDLSKWRGISISQRDAERGHQANWSSKEWVVFLRDGHPAVRARVGDRERDAVVWDADDRANLPFTIEQGNAFEGLAGHVHATKVADGWIVGFNAGEFGAGLWWFAPDGNRRYLISMDHVSGFLQTDQDLLGFAGLAHLGSDHGGIIRITRGANGKWEPVRVAILGSVPRAATRDKDGAVIVVTNKRLVRWRAGKPLETLLDDVSWGYLYPNSVISDGSGTLYVGMRNCVAKIPLTKGKNTVTWLLPK
jgi:hypothetical protein